ncbi:protein TonB [Sphingomonas zeicaulis]|uniref:energy transducer TonB n=1 Tax=Sphingomonas zeicaulis TaxID=1632740 RepID=UPI003D1C28DD
MAYADRNSGNSRVVAVVIVALVHVLLGYAFIVGLIPNIAKKVAQDLKTFEVQEETPPPEEEPPPPPPEQPQTVQPPPVVSPPPIVQTNVAPPPIQTTAVAPDRPVITPQAAPAPPAPPAAPPAPRLAQPAVARGDQGSWVTQDDYPPRALREERVGTSAVAWDINTEGRVENCRVTSSSGSPDLDEAACKNITRRARYKPALDNAGNPIRSGASRRVVWRMPDN